MATKAEKEWMDDIVTLVGCIACFVSSSFFVPYPAVHHILKNGRRQSHLLTLPLCDPGHHQNAPPGSGKISRHYPHGKAQFEAAYGTELELHALCQRVVTERKAA